MANESAAQTAQDDAPKGATAPPQQEIATNGRVVVKPEFTTPSNADTTPTTNNGGGDSGTNGATVTTEQSQAIVGGKTTATDLGEIVVSAKRPVLSAGVAAASDDAGNKSLATNYKDANVEYNASKLITPQPNVLDRFSSYTYQASVYTMSPAQYERLLASKKKTIDGFNLLFQSGGAPASQGEYDAARQAAGGGAAAQVGRSPSFPYDFYIDSIVIDNALVGKATGAAHMATTIKINVVEPNGITLMDRLYDAAQAMAPKDATGKINYQAVAYLLVIRFFGYDQNGVLQQVGPPGESGVSDPNSVVEKFIPFLIRKINWNVGSKLVSYEFDCAPVGQSIASTTRRGTIPYDVELSASTVGELLGNVAKYTTNAADPNQQRLRQAQAAPGSGSAYSTEQQRLAAAQAAPGSGSSYTAPPTASAAPSPKKTLTQGLMGAMNEFQQDLVARKIYEQADVYEIQWLNGADKLIRDKSITLPGFVNKRSTPQAQAATETPDNLDPTKTAMDISVRNFSITAGQQILQAIDLAIRNSQFITEQALVKNLEDGTTVVNEVAITKPVNWYQISMSAQQLAWDNLRKDFAYKITFSISPLPLANIDSKYFPVSTFRGIHKSYPYWFTGQNTAVLDFQQQFNAMYNITVTGTDPDHNVAAKFRETYTSSMREIPFYNFQTGSTESRAGAEQNGNEAAANLAEYLYSPNDLARAKIRIIGDPAWIQQGSIFAGVEPASFNFNAFNPDGTINFDSNQIMFEIVWQRPEDYNLSTGLADPYSGGYSGVVNKNKKPIQSNVYQAYKVVSEFRGGKFEQTLEGGLYRFPKPDKSNTVANSTPAQSDAESRQPANQNAVAKTKAATSAASNGANSPMTAPAPPPAINTNTNGGATGGITTDVSSAAPAAAPESNGETVGPASSFAAPPKIGESDTPQVGTADLGNFYG